jgi:endonuclease III
MKDSKVYAGKIKKLQSALKRAYGKETPKTYDNPLEALVYGMVCEVVTQRQAQLAEKHMADYFIDLNDLRVARPEEIVETTGVDSPAVHRMAKALGQVLNHIFDEQHRMSLDYLHKMGKRQARQALEELTGITPFAVSYCLLTALQGHAIPVTAEMVDYLKDQGLAHPEASVEMVEGFLTKQISAKDNYTFYAQLRAEVEATSRSRKLKTKTKTKTRKKTAPKRTTTKKKTTSRKTSTKKKTVAKKTVKKKTVTKKRTKK